MSNEHVGGFSALLFACWLLGNMVSHKTDAVDNGQNKKAVQLADKILKKQDELQCARVRRVFGYFLL